MTVGAWTTRLLVPVAAPVAAERFYAAAFGRPPTGEPGRAGFDLPGCVVEVVAAEIMATVMPGRKAPLLAIETPDLDAALAEVAQHGGKVERGAFDTAWGRTAVALDAGGNPFLLVEPVMAKPVATESTTRRR